MEPKKRSLGAGERDEFLRAAWRALVAGEVDAARLVFVDEMGANVSLSPLYAWSRRGERAFGSAPRNWGKNVTLLASITAEGVGPSLAVEGVGGRYFEDCNEAEVVEDIVDGLHGVRDYALDPAAADRLWEVSLELLAAARDAG